MLKNLAAEERTVVILKDDDAMIRRAGRNVPWLDFLSFNRLTAHALFYCQKLLLLETAATKLNDFYGADHGAADAEHAKASTPRARKAAAAKGADK
jgi:large subunit ribosomal protein L4